MMTRAELREEFMEPTINRHRKTLLPFVGECCLAAAELPFIDEYLEAGVRLRKSKSPLSSVCEPTYLRWAWSQASEEAIVLRWLELNGYDLLRRD